MEKAKRRWQVVIRVTLWKTRQLYEGMNTAEDAEDAEEERQELYDAADRS